MLRGSGCLRVLGTGLSLMMFVSLSPAADIPITGSPLFVGAADPNGTSFQYTGTLTPADTIEFSVTGLANLQTGPAYGTNAAGVVVTPGNVAGETVGTITDLGSTETPLGSLILKINGIFSGPVFPDNAQNGLGSTNPPQTIVFSGTILELFSTLPPMTNPTLTFVVVDNPADYQDNSGGFTVSAISSTTSSVPLPAAGWQSLIGVGAIGMLLNRKKLGRFFAGARK